jgi:hypothetical protein
VKSEKFRREMQSTFYFFGIAMHKHIPRKLKMTVQQGRRTFRLVLKRVAWLILDCARRTIYMILPSSLVVSSGMGAD